MELKVQRWLWSAVDKLTLEPGKLIYIYIYHIYYIYASCCIQISDNREMIAICILQSWGGAGKGHACIAKVKFPSFYWLLIWLEENSDWCYCLVCYLHCQKSIRHLLSEGWLPYYLLHPHDIPWTATSFINTNMSGGLMIAKENLWVVFFFFYIYIDVVVCLLCLTETSMH